MADVDPETLLEWLQGPILQNSISAEIFLDKFSSSFRQNSTRTTTVTNLSGHYGPLSWIL
jgi:hypothetical protein